MTIGFRPKGSQGPAYHPERDYAYITGTLLKQAVENMSAPDTELAMWVEEHKITDAEIVAVTDALARAQRDFVNAADPVDSLDMALRRRDYYSHRLPVRTLLELAIGRVILAAWFKAVREVSIVNEESPAQNDMCRFSAAVREFAANKGAPTYDANSTAETLLARNDLLYSRLEEALTELRCTQKRVRELEAAAQSPPAPSWFERLMGKCGIVKRRKRG